MKRYELIIELFNSCSGGANPTMENIETDDIEAYMKKMGYITDKSEVTVSNTKDGVIYDVVTNGMHGKYTFSED